MNQVVKVLWAYSEKPAPSIVIHIGNSPRQIPGDNPHFNTILQALRDKKDAQEILELTDRALAFNKHCRGLFEARDGKVFIENEEVPESLARKIFLFEEK